MKLIRLVKQTILDVVRIAIPKERIHRLFQDSLYRNSIYLMLNSTVLALTGFFFWAVAARLYPVEGMGLASAAISAMALISLLSTLGLDYGLIRFLHGSGKNANNMINSCFTLSGLVSLVLSLIFLAGLGIWSPSLLAIRQHPVFFIAFVIFTTSFTLYTFVHRAFIAWNRAEFALAQGLIFGLLRFIPLVALAALFLNFGIFASWGIAISVATAAGVFLLFPKVQPGYRPALAINKRVINEITRFSFANYGTTLLWTIPGLVLPLMVVNLLGAEPNAYFYAGWTTASVLFTIPSATSFSLFAEGSRDPARLAGDVRRGVKLTLGILIPAIILAFLLGDKILLLFGRAYSENAIKVLLIFALSALPVSINYIYFSIKRVEMSMKSVLGLSAFIAITTLGLSYILLPRQGIQGVGVSWLISHSVVALVGARHILKMV